MSTAPNMKMVKEECCKFQVTNDYLGKLQSIMLDQLDKGLSADFNSVAEVKCYITYIHDLPCGEERGRFLALDIGGRNMRVLCMDLKGQYYDTILTSYDFPQWLIRGEGNVLFDHIAECLAIFIKQNRLEDEELSLGFTFSHPIRKSSAATGILIKWTKEYSAIDVVNMDVAQLLMEAIDRRNDIKIKLTAILSDTTGTLMSCAFKNKNCRVGLIVGTGFNICYMEKLTRIETYEGTKPENKTYVFVNTEMGGLGEQGTLDTIVTDYDKALDIASLNPQSQIFEKLVSGSYLGELVRLVIVNLVSRSALLSGKSSDSLEIPGTFKTGYISAIEEDSPGFYYKCIHCLNDLGIHHATNEDCRAIRMICEVISKRAALLCATALSAILIRMDEESVTIGVDGSVYRYHPTFKDLLERKTRELTPPSIKFELALSDDGPGKGAALVAAVVQYNNL